MQIIIIYISMERDLQIRYSIVMALIRFPIQVILYMFRA